MSLFKHEYPYTDYHELNLDWILKKVKEIAKEVDDFVVINQITFSGNWDITVQYPAWTIVTDNNIGYVSIKPVPKGILLTDGNYWRAVIDYTAQIAGLQGRVVTLENDVGLINTNITNLDNRVTTLEESSNKKRIIMISDSYGNRTDSDGHTFFDIIKDTLGLSNTDFYHNNLGGAAFYYTDPSLQFITLLEALENVVTNKNTISDIIVVGGANDATHSYANTLSAIEDFVDYAKSKYPNSKISLFGCGLTFTNVDMPKRMSQCIKPWKDSAKFGTCFIPNSEYVLCNTELLASDFCHPSPSGVTQIAYQLINAILTGGCDVKYELGAITGVGGSIPSLPEKTITVNSVSIYMQSINGVCEMSCSAGSAAMISFNTNTTITLGSGNEIDIEIDKSLFSGYTAPVLSNKTYPCQLYCSDDHRYYHAALIPQITYPGGIKFRIFVFEAIEASANAYRFSLVPYGPITSVN